MKVFLTLQAALIAVTLLLCLHARGLSEDVGITRMDTIEKNITAIVTILL